MASAFFQTAVADADVFNYVPSPDPETSFNSLGGLPPVDQMASAQALYDVVDATTQKTVGEFDGVSSQDLDMFGLNNQEILVRHDIGGSDVPPDGSLFDTSSAFGFQKAAAIVIGSHHAQCSHDLSRLRPTDIHA